MFPTDGTNEYFFKTKTFETHKSWSMTLEQIMKKL